MRDGSGSDIARDATKLQQDGLKKIFNERKVAEQMELGQLAGQVGFNAAGDLANKQGWEEGSKEKVLLHGVVGAAVAALGGGNALQGLSGAAGSQLATNAMQDYLRSANVDPDSAQGRLLMELGSAAVGAAVGGGSGAATALAGEQFNRQLHVDEATKLAALKEGKSEQEQQRLNDAMCALVRCSAGVPDGDPNKAVLIAAEQRGQRYASEQQLIRQVDAFNGYSALDAINDGLLRRDEAITRAGGAVQALGGAAGAVGATAGAVASTPACVSVAGCVAPVGLGGLAVLSAKDGLDGLDKALAPYTSNQGERVLDSFDPRTHWGEQNPLVDLGISAATLAAQTVIAKIGGKLIGDTRGAETRTSVPDAKEPSKPDIEKELSEFPDIQLVRGTKGDWSKLANNPAANTRYTFDNGYSYLTDVQGRVSAVEADLKIDPWDRNTYQQAKAAGCGVDGDCGGHLVASLFGGPGERVNLVPMDAKLNGAGGAWYQMEQEWKKALQAGARVKVRISPVYLGGRTRPNSFNVQYMVDGVRNQVVINNSSLERP